ncbi:hypothetical protein JTE90_021476 [Oedothorax gibbosus]|uniref:Uncharacterized protein n=1 Tax=Oedothorax gibbosus TaxID=931172 RepID=A0AAV6VWF2_9ARAC|nr:hypothetical protein JTE90_021476 [Oedothorax gibbosus]
MTPVTTISKGSRFTKKETRFYQRIMMRNPSLQITKRPLSEGIAYKGEYEAKTAPTYLAYHSVWSRSSEKRKLRSSREGRKVQQDGHQGIYHSTPPRCDSPTPARDLGLRVTRKEVIRYSLKRAKNETNNEKVTLPVYQ